MVEKSIQLQEEEEEGLSYAYNKDVGIEEEEKSVDEKDEKVEEKVEKVEKKEVEERKRGLEEEETSLKKAMALMFTKEATKMTIDPKEKDAATSFTKPKEKEETRRN